MTYIRRKKRFARVKPFNINITLLLLSEFAMLSCYHDIELASLTLLPMRESATQLAEFENDNRYFTAVANNVQDARKLLETGFEYVCTHKDEMLFRKRK